MEYEYEEANFGSLLRYSILTFVVNSFTNPFQVAKTVAQVQYIKKEDWKESENENENENENLNLDSLSNGYLQEPEKFIPPVKNTIEALKAVSQSQTSFALFRGSFVETVIQLSNSVMEPIVEDSMNDFFGLDTTPIYFMNMNIPNILTNLVTKITCSVILNPLQLLRTRLILQRVNGGTKKYYGMWSSLSSISEEEGLSALFSGVVPSVSIQVVRSTTRIIIPILIERFFGIEEESVFSSLIEFVMNNLELLITLPLETVMRRLQAQTRKRIASEKQFHSMVRLSQIPYTGMRDCFRRIVREEGIMALYKGWALHLNTNLLMSVFSLLSSIQVKVIEEFDEDQPEL